MIICKSADEIKVMEEAGKIVARVFLKIEEVIRPGITTAFLDKVAEDAILKENAIPAFKGYIGRFGKKPFSQYLCVY